MLVDNQPIAVDLTVDVGHPHRQIDRLTLRVGTANPLNAVAVPKPSIGCDAKVADLEFERSFDMGEEVLPVPAIRVGADILARRDDVENHEALVRHIDLHDRVGVLGVEGGGELGLQCPDLGLFRSRRGCCRG